MFRRGRRIRRFGHRSRQDLEPTCDRPGSGDFYAAVQGRQNIQKLDAATALKSCSSKDWEGGLDRSPPILPVTLLAGWQADLGVDSQGNPLSPSACCGASPSRLAAPGDQCGGSLYVNYPFQVQQWGKLHFLHTPFGSGPVALEAAPKVPPTIIGQFAARWVATTPSEVRDQPSLLKRYHYYVEMEAANALKAVR